MKYHEQQNIERERHNCDCGEHGLTGCNCSEDGLGVLNRSSRLVAQAEQEGRRSLDLCEIFQLNENAVGYLMGGFRCDLKIAN